MVNSKRFKEIQKGGEKMPKFDEFDLDIKLGNNNGSEDGHKITSFRQCTPGTCNVACRDIITNMTCSKAL